MQGIDIREETDRPTVLPASLMVWVILLIPAGICFADLDAKKLSAQIRPSEKQLTGARAVFQRLLLSPTEKRRIEKLIRNLGDRKWKVRVKATEELSGLGPGAISLIQPATKSKDLEVAIRAELVLKTIRAKAKVWTGSIGGEIDSAIDILLAGGDKKLVAMLIQLLEHGEMEIRYVAEYGLRRLTGKNFGYNCYDDTPKRAKAAAKWQDWWKENETDFAFEKIEPATEPFGILICDDSTRTLTAVTATGKVVWSRTLDEPFWCAAGLLNGNVIIGFTNGKVAEYDPNFKEVWECHCKKLGLGKGVRMVTVCDISRLPNGNTLIAHMVGMGGRVVEVSQAGKVVWQKKNRGHILSARRLPNGNTLIAEIQRKSVFEVNRTGKTVWETTSGRFPKDATRLPNNNVLILEHEDYSAEIIEVDRTGKAIWKRGVSGVPTGLCRLPDGTIAVNRRGTAILLDRNDRPVRQLLKHNGRNGKIRLVPAAVLKQKQSAVSSQPSGKTKKKK